MPAPYESQGELQSGRIVTGNCLSYMGMSPEVPVGALNDEKWRSGATAGFISARNLDLLNGTLGDIDPLELNAVGGATVEQLYAKLAATPQEKTRRIETRFFEQYKAFFGAVTVRAETDPDIFDDEQFYKAACFQSAEGFVMPKQGERLFGVRGRVRKATARALGQAHNHITTKLREYRGKEYGPEMPWLFTVRAELLTAAALMRKGEAYEPTEETTLVLPALTRQAHSLQSSQIVDHKWSTSMWYLGTDAAKYTGVNLETPPDAKLQVKHRGTSRGAARYDASITYVSLVNDIIHAEEEEHIGDIIHSLKREANRSREVLPYYWRDELDFVTRNARAKVGLGE